MKKLFLLSAILCIASPSIAQEDPELPKGQEKTPLVLEYTLVDIPYAIYAGRTVNCTIADPDAKVNLFKGMQYQSMTQATQISTGLTQSLHWGIKQIPWYKGRPVGKTIMSNLTAGVVDLIWLEFVPYNFGWAHEEFHRNAMVTNYTNSFNPLTANKRPGLQSNGLASVGYVLDTNLVIMKKNDNPSFVRLAAAGMESQVVGISKMQQQDFFYRQDLPSSVLYLLNVLSVQGYIAKSANKEKLTKAVTEQNAGSADHQELRDFTGMDPAGWAYDLWNPEKPYAARGLNPYGNGYDRYINDSDLTNEQFAWLKKQSQLAYINFLSPMNFFFHSFTLKKYSDGSTMRGNFSFRYYPTSFGNSIGLDLLLATPRYNLLVSPHINQNLSHTFPGLEAMLFEYPVKAGKQKFLATVDVIADLQPKDQSFFTKSASFTGYINASLKWKATKILYPYIGINAKNKGWIKGNPFLKEQLGCEVGLSARFNYE